MYAIVAVALLFANYKLFLKPTIDSLGKTWPEVSNLAARLSLAKNNIAAIGQRKLQIEDLRGKLASFNKKFSSKQEISSLLKELSNLAKNSDLKIISIKPHSAVSSTQTDLSAGMYQKFPISINALCGYHQLGKFLTRLENADTFMRVADIRITANPQDSTEHMVFILVNTYVLTEGV